MTDKDIIKLASRLEKSLATKVDMQRLERKVDEIDHKTKATKVDMQRLERKVDEIDHKTKATKVDMQRLERKIDEIDHKTNTVLEFAKEVDETAFDHEKRLKRIEIIPVIAHQIEK